MMISFENFALSYRSYLNKRNIICICLTFDRCSSCDETVLSTGGAENGLLSILDCVCVYVIIF